jgi:endonuclease/exonuclease/phosphatase (EEP) superfamily protein YafD
VSDNIRSKRLKDHEPKDIDLIWVELMLQNKKVIVGVGYRPPKQSRLEVETFLEQFRNSLSSVLALGAESVIILGDFNDRCTVWDSTHDQSQLGNDFYDLINVFDMSQLVTECTHFTSHSESLIDLVITYSPGYIQSIDLLPPLGSHHMTQYVEFQITHPRDKCYQRQVWDYDKGNYELLNTSILRYPGMTYY